MLKAFYPSRAEKGLVFHHIPKCAGTSLSRFLRKPLFWSQKSIDPAASDAVSRLLGEEENGAPSYDVRIILLSYYIETGMKRIVGHVPFDLKVYHAHAGTHSFITVLRDPVERFISHYHYSHRTNDHAHIEVSLEAFLETPRAAHIGNLMTWYLCGTPDRKGANGTAALESAKQSLHLFRHVGFVDSLHLLEVSLKKEHFLPMRLHHENRMKASQHCDVSPDLHRKIERLCGLDLELYDFAKSRFRPGS